jgi:RimK family alpha-L-glutamate ligase
MNAVILSAGQGWHNDELQRAFRARGHTCAVLPVTHLIGNIESAGETSIVNRQFEIENCAVVLIRIIPRGSLEQIVFRMDSLHVLAAGGTRVFNPPAAIERTVDKFYTSALLAQAGLPTPRTIVCERSDDALQAFAALGGDVVIKPLFGSMGLGMVRVQDEGLAYRTFRALELERAVFYLQAFVPNAGKDIRAFVLGGRVLAAMERVAPAGAWKTNVARGGQARAVHLTPHQTNLCLHAAAVVGAEYAGVDLLPAADGAQYVLEVNGIPGWQGLQSTTQINIADEIVRYLEHTA